MKIGTSLSFGVMKQSPAFIRDFARRLDSEGVDYVTTAGHLLSQPEGTYDDRPPATFVGPFREPFVLYSHLAAITSHLEFFTSILILPQFPTALVAKQAAELALFSDNRFNLGVGLSWNANEYQALGADIHTRGARMATQIALLRKLWTEPFVTHEDKYHKLENIGLLQLPEKPVPIWIGGGGDERVLRRIAALADGWLPMGDPAPNRPKIREYMQEAGRDPASLMMMSRLNGAQGGPDEWKAEAHRLKDLGATHITIGAAPTATPEEELQTALRVHEALASDAAL